MPKDCRFVYVYQKIYKSGCNFGDNMDSNGSAHTRISFHDLLVVAFVSMRCSQRVENQE